MEADKELKQPVPKPMRKPSITGSARKRLIKSWRKKC